MQQFLIQFKWFDFQYTSIINLLQLVEEHLPKDVMPVVNKYAKCQNAAAKVLYEESSNVLRILDECLKKNNHVEYDYNVYYGLQWVENTLFISLILMICEHNVCSLNFRIISPGKNCVLRCFYAVSLWWIQKISRIPKCEEKTKGGESIFYANSPYLIPILFILCKYRAQFKFCSNLLFTQNKSMKKNTQ